MGGKKGKGGEKERHADKRKDTQENKKRVRGGEVGETRTQENKKIERERNTRRKRERVCDRESESVRASRHVTRVDRARGEVAETRRSISWL